MTDLARLIAQINAAAGRYAGQDPALAQCFQEIAIAINQIKRALTRLNREPPTLAAANDGVTVVNPARVLNVPDESGDVLQWQDRGNGTADLVHLRGVFHFKDYDPNPPNAIQTVLARAQYIQPLNQDSPVSFLAMPDGLGIGIQVDVPEPVLYTADEVWISLDPQAGNQFRHIGPGISAAQYTVLAGASRQGSTLTLDVAVLDVDARGHVVSASEGTAIQLDVGGAYSGDSWIQVSGSQLAHIGPTTASGTATVLTSGSYSSGVLSLGFNSITYDARGHVVGTSAGTLNINLGTTDVVYQGDGTWIAVSGSQISHVGPGSENADFQVTSGHPWIAVNNGKLGFDSTGHACWIDSAATIWHGAGDGQVTSTVSIPDASGGYYNIKFDAYGHFVGSDYTPPP